MFLHNIKPKPCPLLFSLVVKYSVNNFFFVSTPEKALEIIEKEDLHIILTDQRMEPMTGVEFLKSILSDYPDPVRILVTGYADMNAVIDSINMGQVYKYIAKPYPREAMQKAIENAGEIFFLRRDRKELIQKLTQSCSQLEFLLPNKLGSIKHIF